MKNTLPNNSRVEYVHSGKVHKRASDSFARPANTTAYTALDAIADSITVMTNRTYTGAARSNGQGGIIKQARIMTDQSTNTSIFKLHLFTVAPTALADNVPQTFLYANRAGYVGSILFPAAAIDGASGTAAGATKADLNIPFVCESGDTKLYGMLESVDGFTPASAQAFYTELLIEQD
jgi:hypothetical protein